MGLFDKMNKPVFLKEESDATEYINNLKELQLKATGELKEKIDKEIKIAAIGEIGERNIAFELRNSGMPMYILHDIHFEIGDLSAQIDYIVVTRKVTFIIECKNLIGNITIDNDSNFIRNYNVNGKYIKEGIYSPITQNERHLQILKSIKRESKSNMISKLLFDKYFDENYKSIVVLANPKTVLNARYAKKCIKDMVIRADQLNNYIKNVYQQSSVPTFNDKDMKEFAEGLLALHTPNKADYIKKYEDIINIMNEENNLKQKVVEKNISTEEKLSSIKSLDTDEILIQNTQTDNTDELVKRLKAFRIKKCREENIKPYFIFNDKQMMDLTSVMPRNKQELLKVSGFGEMKTEKYGDGILKIINDFNKQGC